MSLTSKTKINLQGRGGGGATVQGRVSLDRIGTPGDILVCKMTDPSMLADIIKASAVVTDEGGSLCHAAIVCMELGIPFVVGTKQATEFLTDGMFIEVNPVSGEVSSL